MKVYTVRVETSRGDCLIHMNTVKTFSDKDDAETFLEEYKKNFDSPLTYQSYTRCFDIIEIKVN